jgi:F-type H+-transporting ATPase subunit delta
MARADALAQGYAKAMLAIAEAEGTLADVEDELFTFGKAVEGDPALREALTDPALPADRKKAVIEELLGSKATATTVRLLEFLIEQGGARDLPKIAEVLADMAAERRHHALAEVRTAVPLDEERRAALAQALSHATGRVIELKVLVDPSVIGGVTARVGDEVFDGTLRRKLDLAREQLSRTR